MCIIYKKIIYIYIYTYVYLHEYTYIYVIDIILLCIFREQSMQCILSTWRERERDIERDREGDR